MFKKGDKVIQVMPASVTGEVASFAVDQETGAVTVKVEWADNEGVVHSRHFNADELALVG